MENFSQIESEILDKIQVKKTESNVEENEEEISEELRKLGYL